MNSEPIEFLYHGVPVDKADAVKKEGLIPLTDRDWGSEMITP